MIISFQNHANLVFERKLRDRIIQQGPVFSQMLVAALQRQPMKGYKSFMVNGEGIQCDFTVPENIAKFDEVGIPLIKRMLVAASDLEMTGITSLFDHAPLRYALDHGAKGKSYREIVEFLGQSGPGPSLVQPH